MAHGVAMTTPRITAPALYAHAIAIEREAIARYSEFAERMADLGNHAVAEVFATLARLETEHLEALAARSAGMKLPELAAHEYRWLNDGLSGAAPETAARELVFRLMTPRHALEIALAGEKRAAAFFEQVVVSVEDAMLRALAAEMAADEADHVALLEKLLETTPGPIVDWASVYDMETTDGQRL
jgi:rubrerythrin